MFFDVFTASISPNSKERKNFYACLQVFIFDIYYSHDHNTNFCDAVIW